MSGGRALWKGQWIGEEELAARARELASEISRGVPAELDCEAVLRASSELSARIREPNGLRAELRESLMPRLGAAEAEGALDELAEFLGAERLREKLARELSGGDGARPPRRLERIDYRRDIFETWAPLGFLVHIAPTNAANVPFLSVLEGLLAGNVNFLKTGGEDTMYPLLCLKHLADCDRSGRIAEFVYAARIPSGRRDLLQAILAAADGIAVWGSEEAVEAIRSLAPPHARIIEWGHKISFAYLAESVIESPELLDRLARDCSLLDQQACSSPQAVYLDTEDTARLESFGERLSQAMERVASGPPPAQKPSQQEEAERTKIHLIADLEGLRIFSGPNHRIYIDPEPGLKASPLYRTVWLKPLPRRKIVATLRPLRHYLQTAGLAAPKGEFAEIAALLFRAGVLRIAPIGDMLGGYMGEPHDGVYALQRYSRRVTLRTDESMTGISRMEELASAPETPSAAATIPIMSKEDYGMMAVDPEHSHLFFKSGGSSGDPKLSIFAYDDYHLQMRLAAQGLYAAGLDPRTDRCMNLFFGGGLYGGFLSFFTILEELKAVQFPMAAHPDIKAVGRTIVDQKVNVLLGMPSYLSYLFHENHDLLKSYGGIRKIFFGGEHFSEAQRAHLGQEFGVERIRSAAYGGNDAGPMGFQCEHCAGSTHHLHSDLHHLEIVALDEDRPVADGEVGRLLFSSRARRGQRLERYEIGDIGRWAPDSGKCACGRKSRKFELLGRSGDIFKAGSTFLNYRKFVSALADACAFSGEVQLTIEPGKPREKVELLYTNDENLDASRARQACLDEYEDLREVVLEDKILDFDCRPVESKALERAPGSGKLRHILDRRKT